MSKLLASVKVGDVAKVPELAQLSFPILGQIITLVESLVQTYGKDVPAIVSALQVLGVPIPQSVVALITAIISLIPTPAPTPAA
jgi:hypothetical protein